MPPPVPKAPAGLSCRSHRNVLFVFDLFVFLFAARDCVRIPNLNPGRSCLLSAHKNVCLFWTANSLSLFGSFKAKPWHSRCKHACATFWTFNPWCQFLFWMWVRTSNDSGSVFKFVNLTFWLFFTARFDLFWNFLQDKHLPSQDFVWNCFFPGCSVGSFPVS